MTIGDLFALIAGYALALVFHPSYGAGVNPQYVTPAYVVLVFIIEGVFATCVAIGLVGMRRQFVHQRRPFAAEWLAMCVALGIAVAYERQRFSVDSAVRWLDQDYTPGRWNVAGMALAVAAAAVLIVLVGRNFLPRLLQTVLLLVAIAVWLWGPAHVVTHHAAHLLPQWIEPVRSLARWLNVQGRFYIACLPEALAFGLPAVAAVARFKRWTWVEGAAVGSATLLGLLWLVSLYFLRHESPGTGLHAERIVVPVWLLATGGVSYGILWGWKHRFGRREPSEK
jgi:hypothetical protein